MRIKFVLIGLFLISVALTSGCVQEDENGCCTAPSGEKMSLSEAVQIAENSECYQEGYLVAEPEPFCNEDTGTWWIDLEPYTEKEGCNPACVVNVATKEATINWRCMGVL